jgi:hypothetical protein
MHQVNVRFTEVKSVLYFDYESKRYLYAGHTENAMHGVLVGDHPNWMAVVQHALARNYKRALELSHDRGLHVVTFDLEHLRVMVNSDQLANPIPEIADLPKVSETDCRSPVGITVGLIDGMIAMARVLRQSNLSATEIQEALKDLQQDEDMKFLMGTALQDWEFGEATQSMVGDNWELGDPLEPVVFNLEPIPDGLVRPVKGGTYKVEYCQKTWPIGWDHDDSTVEFASLEELNEWLLGKIEWCKYEENGFRCRVYLYKDNYPQSMGQGEWVSGQFANVGLDWKPTIDILSEMEWVK